MTASLAEAAEIINRSFPEQKESGQFTNVISPVVIPNRRPLWWLLPVLLLIGFGLIGSGFTSLLNRLLGGANVSLVLVGPHYWLLALVFAVYRWWRDSVVMAPDGCQTLITKFGKLEEIVGAGRTLLVNPWKQVSYVVNTTREHPYNAPIREAPTASRVNASVDLFLQFRIDDPAEFIFTLGGVKGFGDKLHCRRCRRGSSSARPRSRGCWLPIRRRSAPGARCRRPRRARSASSRSGGRWPTSRSRSAWSG
jgi:hypothetical protein